MLNDKNDFINSLKTYFKSGKKWTEWKIKLKDWNKKIILWDLDYIKIIIWWFDCLMKFFLIKIFEKESFPWHTRCDVDAVLEVSSEIKYKNISYKNTRNSNPWWFLKVVQWLPRLALDWEVVASFKCFRNKKIIFIKVIVKLECLLYQIRKYIYYSIENEYIYMCEPNMWFWKS